MEQDYREVDFNTYCPKCEYVKKKDIEEPCDYCLGHPTNLYTDKPTRFKEKEKKN